MCAERLREKVSGEALLRTLCELLPLHNVTDIRLRVRQLHVYVLLPCCSLVLCTHHHNNDGVLSIVSSSWAGLLLLCRA
jgi:hypothetical protein